MQSIVNFLRKNWFAVLCALILLLAASLRFYDYANRWGLGYDQAHDAIVARYAVEHLQVPLLGPFSSAGPYQTGGEWYWLIMVGAVLFPWSINGPWIFMTIFQTLFVLAIIGVGTELINKKYGLLVGLFAAISPSQVAQSVNLTCTAPISFFSLAAIWAMIRYIRSKNSFYSLLLGLMVGVAISIHTQGAALLLLIILTAILGKFSFKDYLLVLFGVLLPWSPVFLAESNHGFFNTKGILQYYLHDQYKIPLEVLGRRWMTYLGTLWPNAVETIIGGIKILGYVSLVMIFATVILLGIKRKLSREWFIIIFTFTGFILALRYVHAPLFDSYFMFASPFIFLLLGQSFYVFLRQKATKILSIILLLIFVGSSIYRISLEISKGMNSATLVKNWTVALKSDYPARKFDIYDYQFKTSTFSFPLLYFLQATHMQDDSGYRIAFGRPSLKDDMEKYNMFHVIPYGSAGFDLLDVESSSSAQLGAAGWAKITPQLVYYSTELWYLKK